MITSTWSTNQGRVRNGAYEQRARALLITCMALLYFVFSLRSSHSLIALSTSMSISLKVKLFCTERMSKRKPRNQSIRILESNIYNSIYGKGKTKTFFEGNQENNCAPLTSRTRYTWFTVQIRSFSKNVSKKILICAIRNI